MSGTKTLDKGRSGNPRKCVGIPIAALKVGRKDCIAAADYATREKAQNHAHVRESTRLYDAIKRVHGTAILPRSTMCGDHLGQMVHQQVRAAASR